MRPDPLVGGERRLPDEQFSTQELTFSLSAIGFTAQTSLTLERYRDVSLSELAATEPDDPATGGTGKRVIAVASEGYVWGASLADGRLRHVARSAR
jgi:hypothetical protein